MGTAVAQIIALNGYRVNLWNYSGDPEPLEQIEKTRENKKYLPGVELSGNVSPQADMAQALFQAEVVFFAVPSCFIKKVILSAAKHIRKGAVCVDMSKGFDFESMSPIALLMKNKLPGRRISSISGPAIAGDMVRGSFTAMNIASKDPVAIKLTKQVLENKNLKLLPSSDVFGVELAGSLKNVYAIAIGVCDGLKISTNTKAVLFVIALQEMGLLVKKMGGQLETVYGLAGLGDLIGTGLAGASRNRRLGEFLAQGLGLNKAMAKVGQTVEGVAAAGVLNSLSKKYKLKTPLADTIYKIVCGKAPPKTGMENFLKNLK